MGDEGLTIEVRNRQRLQRLSTAAVQSLARATLEQLRCSGEIGIHLVSPEEMVRLNWDYLRHEGSTDIITFDHGSTETHLHGECFICVADALKQATEWGTTWPEELGRYVIHGLLHLAGYDDLEPANRRVMKRRENALTRRLVQTPQWQPASRSAASPRRAKTRNRGRSKAYHRPGKPPRLPT